MRGESIDSSSSENSVQRERQFKMIYARQMKKKQALEIKRSQKQREKQVSLAAKQEQNANNRIQQQAMTLNLGKIIRNINPQIVYQQPAQLKWHIYPNCASIDIKNRVPFPMSQLPIFKKKDEILQAIIKNQFVLVTGDTGCGKSTQVPRLIYEYLLQIHDKSSKIMCVQPRRLAVINLQSILQKQMKQNGLIGYQIGMKSHIRPENKIVFVTNGIFLQRLVHSTQFFQEYPFIILDQVHERDIDTDFILLTIKRVIRNYPKVRIILMSATIDNELFRYYFASDHIDNILTEQNFYKRVIRAKFQVKKKENQEEDQDSQKEDENKLYQKNSFTFMKSKNPCPAINVTQPGKFTRTFYYLDTLNQFLPKEIANNRWGSIIFSEKYPNTHKQLYESVCLVINEITRKDKSKQTKASVLIFMPGLGQIQNLSQCIVTFFKTDRVKAQFELIHVHSSILNDDITQKLHQQKGKKHRIIISTNIAESSITVPGIEYVIDFCLSKEIRFDLKSRMQNLQLVWAGKASCNQRAGRTGRVCNGTIIRLVETSFYDKLPSYSTPEMQRSSLDKLILRIKLLHQSETGTKIFQDPGEVLGSAIQPPQLKNIDTAITSLHYCGGLQFKDDNFNLTNLGRLYIDIPIDITYCKLLVTSQLFGTFDDMVILVSILSQSKNAIRRGTIEKNYMNYYNLIDNSQNCDFQALIKLYRSTTQKSKHRNSAPKYRDGYNSRQDIVLEVYAQVNQLIRDITKRMQKKQILRFNQHQSLGYEKLIKELFSDNQILEYNFRFKLTLTCGFLQNLLKIREPSLDDKQEKRIKFMKREGIQHKNTVCVLGSSFLKKPETPEAQDKLKKHWATHIYRTSHLKNDVDMTITYGLSYIHFKSEKDLQKFLFVKYIQENRKNFTDDKYQSSEKKNYLSITEVLKCLGQMDHMHVGRPVTFSKEQGVIVDNFSLNRIINHNQGENTKFLVSNNIAKQSSRMIARYTSLLPTNIKYFQVIAHILFYPFVNILPNKQKTKYEFLQIKKKHKIPIGYILTQQQIEKANQIRSIYRDYLSLQGQTQSSKSYKYFRQLVFEFIYAQRKQLVQEQRWQQVFLKELFEKQPSLKVAYDEMRSCQMQVEKDATEVENLQLTKSFMNEIKPTKLQQHFFSNSNIGGLTLEQRMSAYNEWKQEKLRETRAIERKAVDKDSYLACGQDSCGIRIAKMMKIGPVNREIFRDLFSYESQNVKEIPFSEQNCHFCTLLMSNYIDSQYKTYGCSKGHYFGISLQGESKVKILPFSQLMIIYPDGTAEKANFERLDVKFWKRKHDEKLQERYKIAISTYCFVCDQMMKSFKDLEYHIKESKHEGNVKEFMKSIPGEMRDVKDKNEQAYY